MPYFHCKDCGTKVSYAKGDGAFWSHNGEYCPIHWRIISEKRYKPINVKGRTTMFSAVGGGFLGEALGDYTLFEVIERMYKRDNPDENVIFLRVADDHAAEVNKHNPIKWFVSEFNRSDTYFDRPNTYKLHAINDVCAYAEKGIYPQLRYEPKHPGVDLPFEFVACHFRNIEKAPARPTPERNVTTELANRIIDTIHAAGLPVVLVGKDDPVTDRADIDLNWKLELPEIAWVCRESALYVGRDSGVIHLAAAAGARIFGWNFSSEKWIPKTSVPFVALQEEESKDDMIIEKLKEVLKCGS